MKPLLERFQAWLGTMAEMIIRIFQTKPKIVQRLYDWMIRSPAKPRQRAVPVTPVHPSPHHAVFSWNRNQQNDRLWLFWGPTYGLLRRRRFFHTRLRCIPRNTYHATSVVKPRTSTSAGIAMFFECVPPSRSTKRLVHSSRAGHPVQASPQIAS